MMVPPGDREGEGGGGAAPEAGDWSGAGDERPLSLAQEEIWSSRWLALDEAGRQVVAGLVVAGRLDVAALRLAVKETAARHEVLRARFRRVRGRVLQTIVAAQLAALPVLDLRGLPEPARRAEVERLASAEGRQGCDPARGLLWRLRLLRLGDEVHGLLVTVHGLVADEESTAILAREVAVLYRAITGGRPPHLALPTPRLRYADFAVWQRRRWHGTALAGHLDHWRGRLAAAAAAAAVPLPADRPRHVTSRGSGSLRLRSLSPAALAAAREVSRTHGAPLQAVLVAALAALLRRYGAPAGVVLGLAVANREQAALAPLVGPLADVVMLQVAAGGATFADLLRAAAEEIHDALPHQEVPFAKVVAELEADAEADGAPAWPPWQVQLTCRPAANAPVDLPGLAVRPLELRVGPAPPATELSWRIAVDPDGLAIEVEVDAGRFDAATARRMLGHWERLLIAAGPRPQSALADLPLLGEPELAALLHEWNDRETRCDAGTVLHRGFEVRARRAPDAVAVCHLDAALTFGQLDRAADALSWRLCQLGVAAESRVGLYVDRSLSTVVGILGILKAGGAYVPLDPSFPQERTRLLVEDALAGDAARVVVTERRFAGTVAAMPAVGTVVVLDDPAAATVAGGCGAPPAAVEPDNLAYVIYTSGSTGQPKGVPVTHRNALRLLAATGPLFDFSAADVWTLFHSFAFDFSVWEIWGALLHGGRLIVVPRDTVRDPAAFRELLAATAVTVLNQTPSAFRQLALADEAAPACDLALRWVIFGGEALDPGGLRSWFARHGDERPALANMYGITETTVHVTWRRMRECDLERPGVSPIGRPLADLQTHLAGPDGELVAVGVAGEILVGGAGLARGYLHRPELTAERFVPDPHAASPGARAYRSGDLARRRPDGDLDYLGRLDHQVQVHGHRVELAEIEATVARHPGVAAAVVTAHPGVAGDPWVTAYVVARGSTIAAPELRRHVAAALPDYMVPRSFVTLAALPLTATGKVDRRALPVPGEGRAAIDPDYLARLEAGLASMVAAVLELPSAAGRDDLVELGMDSRSAVRLASRIAAELGIEPPLRRIFAAPTVAALAAEIAARAAAARAHAAAARVPIAAAPRSAGGELPAAASQRLWWDLDRDGSGSAADLVLWQVDLDGDLDPPALRRALGAVLRRHQVLGALFAERGADLVQQAAAVPAAPPPLPQLDLTGLAPARRAGELARLLDPAAEPPFDLGAGPLVRSRLLLLAGGTEPSPVGPGHLLVVPAHPIVADEASLDILTGELAILYEAAVADPTGAWGEPLAAPPLQFGDLAVWERSPLGSDFLRRRFAAWRRRLPNDLATSPERAPRRSAGPADSVRRRAARSAARVAALPGLTARCPLALPADVVAALGQLCRRERATPFMFLLAAFAVALGRRRGAAALWLAVPAANRGREELAGLVGPVANLAALRVDLGGDPTWRALLRQVRAATLAACEDQQVPFDWLADELASRADAGYDRPRLLFDLCPRPATAEGGWLRFSRRPAPVLAAGCDLAVRLTAGTNGGLTGGAAYDREVFAASEVAAALDGFAALVRAAAESPDLTLAQLIAPAGLQSPRP